MVMHLYQYLPGTFKATSSNNASIKVSNSKDGSVDLTASTTPSTKSSSKSKRGYNAQSSRTYIASQKQRAEAAAFGRRTQARIQKHHKENNPGRFPVANIGQGFSDSASVTSEITTPTVLTSPKVGPGYSDAISVHSDLTLPTVMPGAVPDEEFADAHQQANGASSHQDERPSSPHRRWSLPKEDLGIIRENGERQVTFADESKPPKSNIDLRLQKLRQKSMRRSRRDLKEEPPRRRSRSAPRPVSNCAEDQANKPASKSPSQLMEEMVWTTLLHLEEQSACDDDSSVASPILKEMRKKSSGIVSKDGSICSGSTGGSSRTGRSGRRGPRSIKSLDRGQDQTFSFVW